MMEGKCQGKIAANFEWKLVLKAYRFLNIVIFDI